jgi:hypothetical protein
MTDIENPQCERVTCYFCLSEETEVLEDHHIVPRRFGGSDEDENMVRLCPTCHRKIERLYDSRFYEEIGVEDTEDCDDEPGLDAEDIRVGTDREQRDRIQNVLDIVEAKAKTYENGIPEDEVIEMAVDRGMEKSKVEYEISKLKQKGEVYESGGGGLMTS